VKQNNKNCTNLGKTTPNWIAITAKNRINLIMRRKAMQSFKNEEISLIMKCEHRENLSTLGDIFLF
jgi:hypothetical protein